LWLANCCFAHIPWLGFTSGRPELFRSGELEVLLLP
jgi:hypothetical protein